MTTRYSGEAFKRSFLNFAAGRSFNALIGFLIFVWIARQLPSSEYAIYVAAFALFQVGLVVASFGMEWVTAVFVPQVRLNASGRVLRAFVWECAAIQAGALVLIAVVLFESSPQLSRWFGLHGAEAAFRMYAVVMLVDGVGRVFRDQLLSCLLLQGAAQIAQLTRSIALLAVVIWLFTDERMRTAEGLAMAEIVASAVSLALAAWLLSRYLTVAKDDPAPAPDWRIPRWDALLRIACNAWIGNLANLTWGWSVVVLLVARTIGAEATAALGFARNLAEQIRRYMPMEFLLSIVRTLIIARFSQERDLRALGVRVGLMYKANLLFLLPLLVAAIVYGYSICDLISAGRYGSAHWYLVGWLCALVPFAHHRLTDVLAHALSRSDLTLRASLLMTVTPFAVLGAAHLGDWTLLFTTLLFAEVAYSTIVLRGLGSRSAYVLDWSGLGKIFFAAAIGVGVLVVVPLGAGRAAIVLSVVVACVTLWSLVWLLRAWTLEEMAMLPAGIRHLVEFRRSA